MVWAAKSRIRSYFPPCEASVLLKSILRDGSGYTHAQHRTEKHSSTSFDYLQNSVPIKDAKNGHKWYPRLPISLARKLVLSLLLSWMAQGYSVRCGGDQCAECAEAWVGGCMCPVSAGLALLGVGWRQVNQKGKTGPASTLSPVHGWQETKEKWLFFFFFLGGGRFNHVEVH